MTQSASNQTVPQHTRTFAEELKQWKDSSDPSSSSSEDSKEKLSPIHEEPLKTALDAHRINDQNKKV
jgi:hypothetical protein